MTGLSTGRDRTAPDPASPVLAEPDLDADVPPGSPGDNGASTTPVDGQLVRSEEQLEVRTVQVRSGWARLEKFVVTETETIDVPVSREEIRLVFFDNNGVATGVDGQVISATDITAPAGLGDGVTEPRPAGTGQDLTRWLTVSEERVLVSKETVAVARVRLQVETVTTQQQVTEQVRSERIDLIQQPPSDPASAQGGSGGLPGEIR